MDLGASICTPRNPQCLICPLGQHCSAAKAGTAGDFPVKVKKKARPEKFGTAYVVRDPTGALLLRTRPGKGMLAGMSEVPGSEWVESAAPEASPPVAAKWRTIDAPVIHVFTHFELHLTVKAANLAHPLAAPEGMRWVSPSDLDREPLPTLFRKVIAAGIDVKD